MAAKPSPKPRTPRATSNSLISDRCGDVPSTRNLLEAPSVAQSLDGILCLKGSLRFPAVKFRPALCSRASGTRLPLPACGERVGVRGPLRWAQNFSDVCNVAALPAWLRIAEGPPHPRSLRSLDLSPHAGRGEFFRA